MSKKTLEPGLLSIPSWEVEVDGRKWVAEYARVMSFHLGPEDHGIYQADIRFEGAAWGQGLAAHALDDYDEATGERVGTAFGMQYVMAVTARIGSPEDAKGRRVVVFRESAYDLIRGFAPLNDDGTIGEPFFPQDLADRHFPQ